MPSREKGKAGIRVNAEGMSGEDISYAWPYVGLLAALFCLLATDFRRRNAAVPGHRETYLALGLLVFFFGCRAYVNTDWMNYLPMFEGFPSIGTRGDASEAFVEPGFWGYSVVVKSIFPNYFFWVFVSSAIDLFLLAYLLKKYSAYPVLSWIAFFVWYGILLETNLMRNSKSILLFMCSISYLHQRRLLPYLALNLIGVSFHLSSILYLFLYFILNGSYSKKLLLGIFWVGNAVVLFRIHWITPVLQVLSERFLQGTLASKLVYYLASDVFSQPYGLSIGHIERMLAFGLIYCFYDRLLAQNPYNRIFVNCYVLYFLSFTVLGELFILVDRVTMLFVFSYWILYPNLFYVMGSLRRKYVFMALFIPFSFLKVIDQTSNVAYRYDTFLSGNGDRTEREQEVTYYLQEKFS